MNKYLFFDLDDTLVKCSGYFYDVEDIVANKFLEYNINYSFSELKEMFNEKQIENITEHGYGPDNFKYSLMQVGCEVLGYNFFKDNISKFIEDASEILYNSPLELIEGVEDTIKYLYDKGYDMSIITKGSEKVQLDRVNRLPIKDYFKDYYVVKHKLKSDYDNILETRNLKPDECFMIGNSPKGDINEAKLAGLNTIYIPNKDTWSQEDTQIIDILPQTYKLESISDMKKML